MNEDSAKEECSKSDSCGGIVGTYGRWSNGFNSFGYKWRLHSGHNLYKTKMPSNDFWSDQITYFKTNWQSCR